MFVSNATSVQLALARYRDYETHQSPEKNSVLELRGATTLKALSLQLALTSMIQQSWDLEPLSTLLLLHRVREPENSWTTATSDSGLRKVKGPIRCCLNRAARGGK